ncbi:uncharacterized protein LOC130782297 [Actinidia eriantha]|uniref:uncharacterized protein LOC130782297 n=1 Tax=Actinidia eriantha TaxID=165200 RepID=UPI0025906D03|nr:uncharacterized protein LOC130782297 [Actinidia eriantha]
MALRWLLHSAYAIVLGYPNEAAVQKKVKSLTFQSDQNLPKSAGTCVQMCCSGFQMPLHYPRYKKADYEKMEEWKVDMVLQEYGLRFMGSLDEKRAFAMGVFLWPDQL